MKSDDEEISRLITDTIKSDNVKIKGIKKSWTIVEQPPPGPYSVEYALRILQNRSDRLDLSLHGLNIHPVSLGFWQKGYALVGYESLQGSMLEEVITMYVKPTQKSE